MKLYYSAGSCSLAPHIVLIEAGAKFTKEAVDLKTKKFSGGDFTTINPKGYVPALELDNGQILTEGVAIMQYIADQSPDAQLMPKVGSLERYRCIEWLNFIATEVHKGFGPLWNPKAPAETKEMAKQTLTKRLDLLASHLQNQKFLLGAQYTIADAYLFTILNWSGMVGIDLKKWPKLAAYVEVIKSRPAVQAALQAEGLLK